MADAGDLKSSAARHAGSTPASGTSLRRCLIVEDDREAAESLATLLGFDGLDVRVAHDGAAALARAAEFLPQAVLCDLSLPGALDGWALAREMRRNPALAGALLVAMSGYGEEEDRERGRQSGFDEYLVKPLDFGRLREILGIAL